MTQDNKESQQKPEPQSASGSVEARRRRLLTAGASSPLLLTIASRPAWATGGLFQASASASANASGGNDFQGQSISAGWWKNFKYRWPLSDRTSFHMLFATVTYKSDKKKKDWGGGWKNHNSGGGWNQFASQSSNQGSDQSSDPILYNGLTLGEVIDLNGGSDPVQGTLGFHLVGALMNALTFPPDQGGGGYAFTAQQVIDLYNELDGADESRFRMLANTLETANNQFDSVTEKPEPW